MKKKIYSKIAAMFVAVMVLTSCNDLFNVPDIQRNPNAPGEADVDINALVSGTLTGLSLIHEDTDVRMGMMWSSQLAGQSRQHAGFEIYNVTAGTFDNPWYNCYQIASQSRIIQAKAVPTNNQVATGIAQVIEALAIAKMTVLYGDIPYTEAMDYLTYPNPVFDSQASIYASLIALLDVAYTNLTSGNGGTTSDFIYGSDGALWAQAAKTLQARLYLHLAAATPANYANAITSAGLGISATSEDALIPHGTGQTIDNNLNYDFFVNSRPGDTSFDTPAYLPVFMKIRLDGVAQAAGKAIRNTATDETALYNHFITGVDPNVTDGMFTADAPHPLITYYENQFIIAEAEIRQGNVAPAVTALNNVRAGLAAGYINGKTIDPAYQALGMQYTAYAAGDFNPGGLANPVSTGRNQADGLLFEILSQKYIVMLAQYEAWNDVRRVERAGSVVLGIPLNPGGGSVRPGRYIISQNEINTNTSVPKPVQDQYGPIPIWQ